MTLGEIVILLILVVGYIIISLIKKSPEHILNRNLEKYRDELTRNIEELKKDLTLEISEIEARDEQKRIVYTNLIASMSIFIGGRVHRQNYETYVQNFYTNYDTAWLWASDEVLKTLSNYMQFKIDVEFEKKSPMSADRIEELHQQEKDLFLKIIFEMRKDSGFTDTSIKKDDYKFITF
ncbi:hypothetical protein [Oceanobacillus oncorhynchi]|uniref:hypothetical protein n=1 Tax=Oceanobacillus oncorhynchi TaxID=545501 RepID=UPI00186728FB|nr:hypothetical protein [Oceanobacillus oncorhynchi]